MRLVTLLIFLLLPTISFSQVGLKYVHLNWNIVGRVNAPNFKQYLNEYNLNGPKPPGVTDYSFKIRGARSLSLMTGFGTKKGRALFTVSYAGGSTLIDRIGDAPAPEWKKTINYDYKNIGVGVMLFLLRSKNKESEGLPRIEYHLGFDREFNKLHYADNSGANNKYRTNNYGASTFLQYNFYTPNLGGVPVRVLYGINLRYHRSLNPVDFSPLQKDLNYQSTNKLSDGLKDLTLGVTLGFLMHSGAKKVKQVKKVNTEINPASMLELSAVDSITGQPINAKFDVLDEQKKLPVIVMGDKYLSHSLFKDMLTVYVTARAKGYFVRDVAVQGYDTLKAAHEIALEKIPYSPIGVFYFEQSSSEMKGDYTSKVDSLVSVLQRNHHINIAIVGHTSADGSSRLNRPLSLKRAKVIRKLLLKRDVDGERITVSGVGSARPKVAGNTEEYQAENRRVEVFLRD